MRILDIFLLALAAGVGAQAGAACPDSGLAEALAQAWQAQAPVRGLPADLGMERAACVRDRLAMLLSRAGAGPVVGYKAGLTSEVVQKHFGADGPVRGILLRGMLLQAGGEAIAVEGARPIAEADLIVEVGASSVHEARSAVQILASLRAVVPFIELADLTLAEGEPTTRATITAINVGARRGILGMPIRVEASRAFADRLAEMQVVISDESGNTIARAPGSAILGHPLEAVRWLADDLARAGVRLRAGDLLSLGSFGPPVPQRASGTVQVQYLGLPGDPRVSVRFRQGGQ